MTKEKIEILDVCFRLNEEIKYYFINTSETRLVIKNRLKKELSFLDSVICNESNNTSDIIDRNLLKATVIYNKINNSCNYLDLIFGDNIDMYKPYLRYKKLEKIQKIMNL